MLLSYQKLAIKIKMRWHKWAPKLLKEIQNRFPEEDHWLIASVFDAIWIVAEEMAKNNNNAFIATIYDNNDEPPNSEDNRT